MYTHTNTHAHTHTYSQIYIYIYVCVFKYIYMYIMYTVCTRIRPQNTFQCIAYWGGRGCNESKTACALQAPVQAKTIRSPASLTLLAHSWCCGTGRKGCPTSAVWTIYLSCWSVNTAAEKKTEKHRSCARVRKRVSICCQDAVRASAYQSPVD